MFLQFYVFWIKRDCYIPWCKVFVVSDFTAVRERFILQIINEFEMLLVLWNHLVHLWSRSIMLYEMSSVSTLTSDCIQQHITNTYFKLVMGKPKFRFWVDTVYLANDDLNNLWFVPHITCLVLLLLCPSLTKVEALCKSDVFLFVRRLSPVKLVKSLTTWQHLAASRGLSCQLRYTCFITTNMQPVTTMMAKHFLYKMWTVTQKLIYPLWRGKLSVTWSI